jgi:hypothetical protein
MTFEDLEAWQKARAVTRAVYALCRDQVIAKDFGLCSQIQRAAVSTMSNIEHRSCGHWRWKLEQFSLGLSGRRVLARQRIRDKEERRRKERRQRWEQPASLSIIPSSLSVGARRKANAESRK